MPLPLSQVAIWLHPDDNVAIARQEIPTGTQLVLPGGNAVSLTRSIPAGHKLALELVAIGQIVRRYGHPIGLATMTIAPGDWVHSHNLEVPRIQKEYSFDVVPPREPPATHVPPRSFMGYRRANGRAGTRNYVAVISTSNCSAHVTMEIARTFSHERLSAFPNVDGVIPIVHSGGCSFVPGGLTHQFLRKSLTHITRNPNIAAFIFVAVGCEENQIDQYCDSTCLQADVIRSLAGQYQAGLIIQERGGFRQTVAAGVQAIERVLPQINAVERTPQPLADLVIGLQCGGSDGWSGVTANPLLGRVVDAVVEQGGTAVLSETPEIFGAEELLTRRVASEQVGRKLVERFVWWNELSARLGFTVDNNPTPGNKRGGLTTIFEKSLGAVAKGGSTPLIAAYEYADQVDQHGLVFMDTPGNDPVSATGQLAGGCNLIVFTTGRGSLFASNVAPCVKVASNSTLYARMTDDMDYDAGKILQGHPFETASEELLDLVIATASGQRTKSEEKGLPDVEFVPWQLGPTL
jgi:altronate hydrolase